MRSVWLVVGLVLAVAPAAGAQTKIAGTEQCGKPEVQHSIPVGDRPDHVLLLSQSKCTWPKPAEIGGIAVRESVITAFDDAGGGRARSRGYDVGTMANGDQVIVRWQGVAVLGQGGGLQSAEGTWSFLRGIGKLKGIKGEGTFKFKALGEGITNEVEGEYTLPK